MVGAITGGLVVAPDGVHAADVLIDGGRIGGLVSTGHRSRDAIAADGCYVLPGGVDPHTHLLADIASATRSAACGGTTTAISFTLPHAGESPADAVLRARDELLPDAAVDVALHAYVSDPDSLAAADIEECARLGVTGIKLFTAYPELGLQASDRTVFETVRTARLLDLPVLVHCENGGVIAALVEELVAAGRRDPRAFAESRPPETEVEAVARVAAIAGLAGGRVYIVHISTAGALDAVRAARARGVEIVAEVCTHHLALDASAYDRADGERYLGVPPLRAREHLEALWAAVRDGTLDAAGSDHAQARFQPEPKTDDFTGLAYGFAGVEARLPVLLSLGRGRGVSLERLVELLSTGPARTFGLYPRKGVVEAGADADVVVWDPNPEWTVERSSFHDGTVDTPYADLRLRGRVRYVVRGGELLVAEDELVGGVRGGRFLPARGIVPDPEPAVG